MIRLYKPYVFVLLFFVATQSCNKNGTTYTPPEYIPPTVTTFTNPLLSSGPDPWVIKKDSFYYYTNTSGDKINIWKTKTMSQLGSAPVVTIWTKPATGPNSENIWAPELHFIDNKWYMYYTAGTSGDINTVQRLFVLENTSADPTQGTWVDKGKVADPAADFWAIDATVFEQNGSRYILWSGHASDVDFIQRIYIARLQNPWTLATGRTLISSPDYPWEKIGAPAVNEGPEILKNNNGDPFLIFSASSCFTDDYSMGMLVLKSGGNPLLAADWTKSPNPVFGKKPENNAFGPGHGSFFKSPDGTENWMLYHANSSANQGCGDVRNPRIQKFTFNADGTPNFGEPVKTGTAITKPSGEK